MTQFPSLWHIMSDSLSFTSNKNVKLFDGKATKTFTTEWCITWKTSHKLFIENSSFSRLCQQKQSLLTEHSRHVCIEIKQTWSDAGWALQSGKPQVKSILAQIDMCWLLHVGAVANDRQQQVVHVDTRTTDTLQQHTLMQISEMTPTLTTLEVKFIWHRWYDRLSVSTRLTTTTTTTTV